MRYALKIIFKNLMKIFVIDIDQESIVSTLEMIHPKIEAQSQLVKKFELVKGLKVGFSYFKMNFGY